ncbi:hypothetical protein [Zunongwangia pacifica]|uniref:Uncharacterized protein n=1 Tax=Zunongwangia pacifica TaxID=2911062 RepID=A0A9X1ZR09_9FLAO|nr:hypothetical protein [Zunongwangia pacifica]MCL6217675.1 hypothetical protein [Zunongwangia pacifica]
MRNLFTLLIFGSLLAVTYSCEPESLPQPEAVEQSEIIDIEDTYSEDYTGREENEQERRDPPEEDAKE